MKVFRVPCSVVRSGGFPKRRRVAALTLVELMVAAVIVTILTVAVTYAFVAGLDMERNQAHYALEQDAAGRMERRVTQLLQGAKLSSDATDTATFFVGEAQGGEDQLGSDRLTFTTIAPAVSLAAQASDDDFETQQKTLGPQGGMAEISLGVTAQGDAGNKTGLFERLQRPSDGDYTQGGMESVLEEQVKQIGFQFYNGTAWVGTWDTVNGGEKRLPSAVRVNYILRDDPKETPHAFTVPLPASDVDAQNPSTNGATL